MVAIVANLRDLENDIGRQLRLDGMVTVSGTQSR